MSLSDRLKIFSKMVAEPHELDVFNEFVFPHARLIYDSAFRLCGNQDDAEDLLQETFFHAIKSFGQLKERDKCKYWLFSILKNLFLKQVERGKKRTDLEFDLFSDNICDISYIENEFLRDEVERNLRDILEKLDERLRGPILMFYFERLTYKEIADLLRIPIGTVMSRIARGKVYLKKELMRSEYFRTEIEFWLEKNNLSRKAHFEDHT